MELKFVSSVQCRHLVFLYPWANALFFCGGGGDHRNREVRLMLTPCKVCGLQVSCKH